MKRLLAAGLLLAAFGCADRDGGPAVRATPEPGFQDSSAYALLERQVAFGPRVPGSPGHQAQLEWMTAYLRERADTVVLQPFTHTTSDGDTVRLTNVFARFQPDTSARVLLITHWDTRPIADQDPDADRRNQPIPGANDGASGTAVLMELADVFSRHSPPIGVDLLFTDGEDYAPGEMYLGAKYFAANLPAGYRPLYGVLVDMVGDRNPAFPVEPYSNQYAPEVVARVWRLAEDLDLGRFFPKRSGIAALDDHIPLNEAGIRTIDIIDFDYRQWHTVEDDVENTAPHGLEAVGTVLAELVYRGG
ncbi:MAG TPA: M28 family peptidase [Longimicrobiales bacterium]